MSEPVFEMFWKRALNQGDARPAALMSLYHATLQVSFANKISEEEAAEQLASGAMVMTRERIFRKQV